MLRSNAVMNVTVPYNKFLFSVLYFLTSQSEFDFGIDLVLHSSGVPDLAPKPVSLTEDPCGFPQSLRENARILLSSTVNNRDIDIVGCFFYLSVSI